MANGATKGVTAETLTVEGVKMSGLVFRHSRKGYGLAFLWSLVMVACGIGMYLRPEMGQLPIVGKAPTATRIFAVLGGAFFLGMAISSLVTWLNPHRYVALLPEGILITSTGPLSGTGKPPLFLRWDALEAISAFESSEGGKERSIGIRIHQFQRMDMSRPQLKLQLKPHLKRMEWTSASSGWHWIFHSKSFQAPAEVVETAMRYFFYQSTERVHLGTPRGLSRVQEAVAEKWQPLILSYRGQDFVMRRLSTIEDYRDKFRTAPVGRWSQAVGTFSTVMDELWEFSADHSGRILETGPFGGERGETLFEWKEVGDFTIACRVTQRAHDAEDEDDEGEQDDDVEEEAAVEPEHWEEQWETIRYDFAMPPTDGGDTVTMRQVSQSGALLEGFWLSMVPLASQELV